MLNQAQTDATERYLAGYGAAKADIDRCATVLDQLLHTAHSNVQTPTSTHDAAQALQFLSELTFPETRHVLFETQTGTTVFVNNGRDGSDYTNYASRIASALPGEFARVVRTKPLVWSRGELRETLRHEARIFEVFDKEGLKRSVVCMNDGRWIFETSGIPHPIESNFPYHAKRKADRFRLCHLEQLSEAFSLAVPRISDFVDAKRYVMVEAAIPIVDACSIEEADDPARRYLLRGRGWDMSSQAASIVADFERCIAIDPRYEPLVRDQLREAYLRLGRD